VALSPNISEIQKDGHDILAMSFYQDVLFLSIAVTTFSKVEFITVSMHVKNERKFILQEGYQLAEVVIMKEVINQLTRDIFSYTIHFLCLRLYSLFRLIFIALFLQQSVFPGNK
jgi:hypothetical protein